MPENLKTKKRELAILVGVVTPDQNQEQAEEYIQELDFLAQTAGANPVKHFLQKLSYPNPKTFIGKGKLEEIKKFIVSKDITLVVFDDELGPSQIRNLEKFLEIKILDRSNLILDIFASRAQTAHARTQVELAQYQYLLPRLTRMWTHLERQKGGIGMRGPGETQIETDRRIIQQKIALLKEKLKKIDKQKSIQRGNRGALVRVALVGYTNVGKSTIMNTLAKTNVLAENKLFATLDTTVRKIVIENLPFLLSDTVGFIRKLPHQLVESFKSTLDEVREADVLLHIVDVSHPNFEEQIEIVNNTLLEIEALNKPTVMVFNKIDLVEKSHVEDDLQTVSLEQKSLEDWRQTWIGKNPKSIFISTLEKQNWTVFKTMIYNEAKKIHAKRFPYNKYLY